MGASEPEPSNECKVCGKMFDSVEDLAAHNREAHVSGSDVAGSIKRKQKYRCTTLGVYVYIY